jgi:magnesium transporter
LTTIARLFDADGHDTRIDLATETLPAPGKRRLVWIDVDARDGEALAALVPHLDLSPRLLDRLADGGERPELVQYPDHVHLSIRTLDQGEPARAEPGAGPDRDPVPLDLVAGKDWVLTVHEGAVPAIDRILDGIEGETQLGALDAAGFLASIVDSAIVGYYRVIEGIEADIDTLDDAALRHRPGDDLLADLVAMRRRISAVRRALTPHREAFAVLARPDFALHEELGRPWPGLVDRLEGAIDSVEQTRESLLGTYDVYMGREAQRDSTVMKTLTIVSAVLLPAVVLAGIMGMNFDVAFFDDASNFWVVLGLMAALAIGILGFARWRAWI